MRAGFWLVENGNKTKCTANVYSFVDLLLVLYCMIHSLPSHGVRGTVRPCQLSIIHLRRSAPKTCHAHLRVTQLHNLYLLNVRRSGALGGPLGLDLIINGDRCTFATDCDDGIDTRCPAVNPAHNVIEVAVLRKQFGAIDIPPRFDTYSRDYMLYIFF
jgi:hypothetical protein